MPNFSAFGGSPPTGRFTHPLFAMSNLLLRILLPVLLLGLFACQNSEEDARAEAQNRAEALLKAYQTAKWPEVLALYLPVVVETHTAPELEGMYKDRMLEYGNITAFKLTKSEVHKAKAANGVSDNAYEFQLDYEVTYEKAGKVAQQIIVLIDDGTSPKNIGIEVDEVVDGPED